MKSKFRGNSNNSSNSNSVTLKQPKSGKNVQKVRCGLVQKTSDEILLNLSTSFVTVMMMIFVKVNILNI